MARSDLKHISFFFVFVAVSGLFGSLTHYHSEGLDCLNHADEPHYVENDSTCPVCTLVLGDDSITLPSEYETLFHLDEVVLAEYTFTDPVLNLSEPGRAPPFLI